MAKITGHQWRVAFNTSGIEGSLNPRSFTPPQPSRGEVDMTDLQTADYLDFEPADLADGGEFSFEAFFEPDAQSINILNSKESITLTFGQGSGQPQWTFDGFITQWAPQQATFNEAAMLQVTVRVAGPINEGTS